MDNQLENYSIYLAQNLENLRKKRNFSQMQLATLSHIPRSTLAHLESSAGNPTIETLLKISKVLQVSIEELIKKPISESKLIKKDQVPVKIKDRGQSKIFKILMDKVPGMEIDKMQLNAGSSFTGIPHTRGTKEYFYLEKGILDIIIAGEIHHLTSGDLLIFKGDQAHSYANRSSKMAIGFSVVAFL